jgi:opacity protein-like surface antigen
MFQKAIGIALGVVAASSVQASEYYIGVEGGKSWVGDTVYDLDVTACGSPGNCTSSSATNLPGGEYETGFSLNASAGVALSDHWRTELEVDWRTVESRSINFDLVDYSVFLNAIYAVGVSEYLSVEIGFGLGLSAQEFGADAGGVGYSQAENSLSFAYQGILGLEFPISETVSFVTRYRLATVLSPEFDGHFSDPNPIREIEYNGQFTDVETHTLSIGLRYAL